VAEVARCVPPGRGGERVSTHPSTAPPTVAIVVLNYCAFEDTVACAEAALASRGILPVLLVVDSASPDGSGERLFERFGPARVVLCEDNGGYAGGMNTGLAWTRTATDASYVLLLTPDVRVEPGTVFGLVCAMDAAPQVGVAGPCIRYGEGYAVAMSAGGVVEPRRLRLGHLPAPRAAEPYPVAWLDGGCLLLRREAVDAVGGFDERYFMYFEENDLCHRLRARGWEVTLVPGVWATHRTAALPGAHYFYYMARNGFRYWREHHGRGYARVGLEHVRTTAMGVAGAIRAVLDPRRWPQAGNRWTVAGRQIAGVVSGTRDAALGRWGRRRD
jgi:N-acetylglucosaminyl-diphospho-decaprenol L-rhamnosyltransferase